MEKKRTSTIPTDLSDDAVVEISGELRKLLADACLHFTLRRRTSTGT